MRLRQIMSVRTGTPPQAAATPLESRPSVGPSTLHRSIGGFLAAACVFVVAGGIVAAVDSAAPFEHGAWLAAFLVLVGGASQALLGAGRIVVGIPPPSTRLWRGQFLLWNLGSLGVVAGVLGDAPGLVTAGSVALLCALALFASALRTAAHAHRARAIAYALLASGLTVSVVVGSALADAAPGGWL